MLVDVTDHHLGGRSNSAAKKADADFEIAFAWRSSLISCSSSLIRSRVHPRRARLYTAIDLGLLHPRPHRLDTDSRAAPRPVSPTPAPHRSPHEAGTPCAPHGSLQLLRVPPLGGSLDFTCPFIALILIPRLRASADPRAAHCRLYARRRRARRRRTHRHRRNLAFTDLSPACAPTATPDNNGRCRRYNDDRSPPTAYGGHTLTVRLHGNDDDTGPQAQPHREPPAHPARRPRLRTALPPPQRRRIHQPPPRRHHVARPRPQHRPRPPAPQPPRLRGLTINSLALHRHRQRHERRHSPPETLSSQSTSRLRACPQRAASADRCRPDRARHAAEFQARPTSATPVSWAAPARGFRPPIAPAPPPSGRSKTSGGCVVGRALGNGFRDFRNACGRRLWLRSAALLLGIRFRSVSGF